MALRLPALTCAARSGSSGVITQIGKPPPLAVRRAEVRPLSGFAEVDKTVSNHELPSSGRRPSCESGRAHPTSDGIADITLCGCRSIENGQCSGRSDVGLGKFFGSCVSGTAWSWWKGTRCRTTCICCWASRRSSVLRIRGGVLKGKSAIRIHREYLGRQRNFTGYHFWAKGYCVSTVGLAEDVIREYIRRQETDEIKQEKLTLG